MDLSGTVRPVIDLNSDLGEGFGLWSMGNDTQIMQLVSSANIACGFHAGDPTGLRQTLRQAAARGVRVGAHIGYRDLIGFGQRDIDYSSADLTAETIYQLGALDGLAQSVGTRVSYVKPHGALYNRIAVDRQQAAAVIAGIQAYNPDLPLMGLAGSRILDWASELGLPTLSEGFVDRAYNPDGSLVDPHKPGANLTNAVVCTQRAVALAQGNPIAAADGSEIYLEADSLCIHADHPDSFEIVEAVVAGLTKAGFSIGATD